VKVKRCLIDCSEQQPNERTGDLPMTTTYESIDASYTPEDAVYTSIQKPEHVYENAEPRHDYLSLHDDAVPVNSN